MLELVLSGGWLMAPILVCSFVSSGIIVERFWTLRRKRVLPESLAFQVIQWARSRQLDDKHIEALRSNSPLGEILAAALANREQNRDLMKEAVEDVGRHVVHGMERFLNSLGTIAGVSPLLGLLGTVVGMIKVFSSILAHGVGDAPQLAGGISQALITTAAGLTVAIPSYMFYRYFQGRVAGYVVEMEKQSIKLIDDLSNTIPADQ